MKRDFFGTPQPEADDDLTAAFEEHYGNNDDLDADRETFEHNTEDPSWGWSCEVKNRDGDALTIRGFESEAAMRAYLKAHGASIYEG